MGIRELITLDLILTRMLVVEPEAGQLTAEAVVIFRFKFCIDGAIKLHPLFSSI